MKTVILGIQARSTSTRLPNKVNMQVGGKPILQHVLDACQIAARFLRTGNLGVVVNVVLLVPKGDSIATHYRSRVPVYEGDEHDVLSRYVAVTREMKADIVVRITADCLFIPPHHIAKHVKAALIKGRDYTTNTHHRTHKEGWDCEVLSGRLVEWLNENATTSYDREHVTTLIGKGKPFPFIFDDGKPSVCHVINFCDESEAKTSIDTLEEFEHAEKLFQRYQVARLEAKKNGTYHV
jgi:spore coat polysaccharide biosynthesis protein SpsF (cytidylyltransferase family)